MVLRPLPPSFAATRGALHRVAEQLVAPARKPDNEIALTVTPGGFGTPPFEFEGARHQVRVEADELVHERDGAAARARLATLADGADLLGERLVVTPPADPDQPLGIDRDAARALADFYGLAAALLREFRAGLPAADEPSPVTLWPEHFDLALEAGSENAGTRANYGASPGDDEHAEPYLYVGPWTAQPPGETWNATAFAGAELGYAELLRADDPRAATAEFLAGRRAALLG